MFYVIVFFTYHFAQFEIVLQQYTLPPLVIPPRQCCIFSFYLTYMRFQSIFFFVGCTRCLCSKDRRKLSRVRKRMWLCQTCAPAAFVMHYCSSVARFLCLWQTYTDFHNTAWCIVALFVESYFFNIHN